MKCRICDICKRPLMNISEDMKVKIKDYKKWKKMDICYDCGADIRFEIRKKRNKEEK